MNKEFFTAPRKKYFGTDGMRGTANKAPITPDLIMKLAVVTAHYFKSQGKITTNRVIIGKDTRLSGYMLEPALTSGFISMGFDVLLLGPVPTPGVSMLTRSLRADIGVMLSASHNPFQDNGVKLFDSRGLKLNDTAELAIESHMEDPIPLANATMLGRAKRLEDVPGRYIEFLKAQFPKGMRLDNIRIVVDSAHGAAYKIAPEIFWELGCDVISTGISPNGRNINDQCGATHPEHVSAMVQEHKADLGIALDGDADRIQMIDKNGKLYSGEHLLAILASFWCKNNRLSGHALVSTIMANLGFEKYLASMNLGLWRTQVGDRYVAEKMTIEGCNLGGEPSGHLIMNDFTSTGDGVMSALQILACLREFGRNLEDYAQLYENTPSYNRNLNFATFPKNPLFLTDVIAQINSQNQRLTTKDARLIVRTSGTEPLIRITAEGDDKTLIHDCVDTLYSFIQKSK